MNKHVKTLVLVLVTALAVAVGTTQAQAGRDGYRHPVVVGKAANYRDLGNGTTETKFVAITPCRLFDTRKYASGAPIPAGSFRPVMVRGPEAFSGQFEGQGGKPGGCGIPKSATSIEATVTVINPSGTGYLRAFPEGQPEPTATFLNYLKGFNVSNTGTIAICNTTCPLASDMRVKTYQASLGVVIDVQGYTIKPMAAVVNQSGGLERGSRVLSAEKYNGLTGQYRVKFDRNLGSCAMHATLSTGQPTGEIEASYWGSDDTYAFVVTRDSTGAAANKAFELTVTC